MKPLLTIISALLNLTTSLMRSIRALTRLSNSLEADEIAEYAEAAYFNTMDQVLAQSLETEEQT